MLIRYTIKRINRTETKQKKRQTTRGMDQVL